MIPVFQTRVYANDAGGFGNCLEACLASILEVPLAVVPERAFPAEWRALYARRLEDGGDLLELADDAGAVAAVESLKRWLARQGVGVLDFDLSSRRQFERFAKRMDREHRGYWIAMHYSSATPAAPHVTVWRGESCVHDPSPGYLPGEGIDLKRPLGAWVLTAADPARFARWLAELDVKAAA